ncbi:EutN/CcmL family microcompartment protein [Sporolactobacillus shoreicorticis]|uniref:EutN/CcmL family microcompartment protein n=1 Tax=Sporolactobacillus shoreicorticis TaxID=1923877 RepID=A0ABW5S778_9BACL|nr:EutN/CcmL family microcompartment protein [Sporolactobacillus shoreicorticis]MCO7124441.1 EutN/CcmL family microcompartment protein [Sporolactobacillus shoreicorticis]
MYLAKVVGNVVSTKKKEELTGYKLMIVTIVGSDDEKWEKRIVAVDLVGAGRDEYVLVSCGSSARAALKHPESPIDAAIVGIIDSFAE